MRVFLLGTIFLLTVPSGPAQETDGLERLHSNYSVQETVGRLDSLLTGKGMKVFARINFTADAQAVGLDMNEAQLLIFGNPRVGTPIMKAHPTTAIDLPLKALIWEDGHGQVFLGWNDPGYLTRRHGVADSVFAPISGVITLFRSATE